MVTFSHIGSLEIQRFRPWFSSPMMPECGLSSFCPYPEGGKAVPAAPHSKQEEEGNLVSVIRPFIRKAHVS